MPALQGVERKVAGLVGLDGACLNWLHGMPHHGGLDPSNATAAARVRTCRRLYAALVLNELVQEVRRRSAWFYRPR